MKRFDARDAVVEALKKKGFYRGEKENPMVVPICRCGCLFVCLCVCVCVWVYVCVCVFDISLFQFHPHSLCAFSQPLGRYYRASSRPPVVPQLHRLLLKHAHKFASLLLFSYFLCVAFFFSFFLFFFFQTWPSKHAMLCAARSCD